MNDCAIDNRAIFAAQNNADLYEAIFEAQALRFEKHVFAFVAVDIPPPYYANVTILDPNHNQAVLSELARITLRSEGALAVKDSFCQLELGQNGFKTVFDASWIWRDPRFVTMPDEWHVIQNSVQLAQWEQAWKENGSPTEGRMFPDTLLDNPRVNFLGTFSEGRYTAGCIANLSNTCIGLSNIFAEMPSVKNFGDAANSVASLDCARAVVGYEAGLTLDFAETHGFEPTGDLRVLIARDAKF
ncbi:MAG: hypothetical protein ABJL72_19490 [Roseobacter sp.]